MKQAGYNISSTTQVGADDTPQTIALMRSLTVTQLQAVNNVSNVNAIRPGTVICVPDVAVCNTTYTCSDVSS